MKQKKPNKYYLTRISAAFLAIVGVGAVLPLAARALTYQELKQYQATKGKVLGTTTLSGDLNHDGIVNSLDAVILVSHYNQNYTAADLNGDGVVNNADYIILKSQWFHKQ